MESFIREIATSRGDIYRIRLSEEDGLLSKNVQHLIGDTHIMGIELLRIKGKETASHITLKSIEDFIAEIFGKSENLIIMYYCDFINPIPHTNKNAMPPQEYRSRLFENMFKRYAHLHHINDVRLSVVEVNGLNETYYFHLIYREKHTLFASLIGNDIKEGYSK